jgi:hypothetical protein
MRALTLSASLAVLLAFGNAAADPAAGPASGPAAPNPAAEEAKALIKEFAGTLKDELQAAIKAGGPISAIAVCKDRAPAIAAGLAARSGWEVKRTSLKPRNLALDTPDAWERQVLNRFEERKTAGEAADTLAYSAVVDDAGTKRFRFMKAIPTGDICLACHGKDINPDVASALDAAYPQDQARGYALGDIRGAFSVSKAQ